MFVRSKISRFLRAAARPSAFSDLSDKLALGLGDEIKNALLIASAMEQDEAAHSQLGEALRGITIDSSARSNADLDFLEAPPSLATTCPQGPHPLRCPLPLHPQAHPPT